MHLLTLYLRGNGFAGFRRSELDRQKRFLNNGSQLVVINFACISSRIKCIVSINSCSVALRRSLMDGSHFAFFWNHFHEQS